LTALAELPDGTYAGAGSIARQIGARANYLGKMLQLLAGAGLVVSQKGLGGGFRLAREAERITLFDVLEPIDHVSRWSGCFLGREVCSEEDPCTMHHRWADVRDRYMQLLNQTTIAEVARRPDVAARG
jgi:Rrf2 family protein